MKIYGDEKGAKAEWEKLKGQPLKKKLSYIATYYGVAILIVLGVLAIAVSMTISIIKNKVPKVIQIEFITAVVDDTAADTAKDYLCGKLGLEPKKYNIEIGSSIFDAEEYEMLSYQLQKIGARITSKDLDIMGADEATFKIYMSKDEKDGNAFADLRDVLPADEIERLDRENRLIWYEASYGSFPYLINVYDSELVHFLGIRGPVCLLGVPVTCPHPEATVEILKLVRGGTTPIPPLEEQAGTERQ